MNHEPDAAPILRVENLCKVYAHVVANDNVNLELKRGEIHCLLGENGAGKTTLIECIFGAYKPSSGKIYVKGRRVDLNSPKDAIELGIGVIHQNFVLVPPMSVIENILVGTRMLGLWMKRDQTSERVQALCQTYGISLNLNAAVADLSLGEQQWVEILKALYAEAEILILDEPTAVLTPQETDRLFDILRKMTRDGLSIILVTHKLREVIAISDRVTVLRRGQVVATVNTADVAVAELAHMMVGRDVGFHRDKVAIAASAKAVLELNEIRAYGDDGQLALTDISLQVRSHEILGLAGVGGNGQTELFDAIVGVRPLSQGSISIDGKDVTVKSPSARFRVGLASIAQDRIHQGLLMDCSVQENLILGLQHRSPFSIAGVLQRKAIEQFAQRSILSYEISTSGPKQRTGELSGGNLQKLILARELWQDIKCLVAGSPTRGLDVGAADFVHERLADLRDAGVGIFLISEDIDEVIGLSDRIAVIFEGRILGVFEALQITRQEIGLLMAGVEETAE
jgi:ABC-type uncharacterized transport system ATPase subunit